MDKDVVKCPVDCHYGKIETPVGEEGSSVVVIHEGVDMASGLTAGHVGSCLMPVVTVRGKNTVSVNKEMSAVVGSTATEVACKYGASSIFADSEYSVTP